MLYNLSRIKRQRKGIILKQKGITLPLSINGLSLLCLWPHFLAFSLVSILHWYFKRRLEELSTVMDGEFTDDVSQNKDDMDLDEKGKICKDGEMDVDECYSDRRFSENSKLVKNIGKVVLDLRSLGFTSMAEDAYASAIFLLLKAKVYDVAGDDFRSSVLQSIQSWIQAVPLQFLHALLVYLGDSVSYESTSSGLKSPLAPKSSSCCPGIDTPSESLVRWKLRLEYFAYETLQDLRIAKLFEIIVDYPDSSPAIEDLKLCLEYTGQHSKLVESFISALRYRLLTAGASTNDILHQYVSTIKALRTIDPAGVFLEAVGEPIRDYLRGRRDTIKCIVTMLTDGTGGNSSASGNPGDSLLEELNRDEEIQENFGIDDDFNTDDRQAWINATRWQPDPVEADPLKGSRNQRKVDILGMIVGIIGSKDQLVHEYRTMLAEKLLNKSDYDIDSEIRTLELLKIHFGESSLQKCEIMLNDLIGSKRVDTNIKATISQLPQTSVEVEDNAISMDKVAATIISSNFWPPIQDEPLNLPEPVDKLLSDYAKRFSEVKTPRKLQWKKSLGTVKLELQFEDREMQFTVAPVLASIIMKFQDQTSWTSKHLAAAIGIPVDVLNRRINFWISKGVIAESSGGDSSDLVYTIMENMAETSRNGGGSGNAQELLGGDEEEDRSVASVENQLRKEMTVYEKFILGMLTNFGSMALDRIHNTLKMFCIADPPYDKSLQQLQSFLSGLVSEEKLELRDGVYFLKK
ncbi:anaphase-promoting complex subunit 2 isoform X2 [Medicago truncatula]|uniref:anaphase-promoting complex subunit 2 isoform X2 n=1 Tax=Medicago truncatula TaxID=3880 RepID=UPI000D2F1C17|nr:anaphase-promoting complex subunit 2 isoform X2 [Medicago truncatula]